LTEPSPFPPLPDPEAGRRRARRERWAIVALALFVSFLTLFEAKLATTGGAIRFSDNIAIFALINFNVILIVLLIFLVTRNLFKVILDRRRGILGARIRARLVVLFIGFSLVPSLLLFLAAANITTSGIRAWIGGRVGIALNGAIEIARENLDREAARLAPAAREAAASLSGKGGVEGGTVPAVDGGVSFLVVPPVGKATARGRFPDRMAEEVAAHLRAVVKEGEGAKEHSLAGEGYAAYAVPVGGGGHAVAVRLLTEAEAERHRNIVRAYDEYHEVRLLDDPIRASYIGLLVLITLLIVFSASWMGIYLARQITIPVQLLAEATGKVAAGDLDVQLEYRSDDEIGVLVSSFNRMTADLKATRTGLTEANATLSETYDELSRRNRFTEAILSNITTAVLVLDGQGRVVTMNPLASRLLGVDRDRSLGRYYRDVFQPAHYEVVRDLWREAVDTGLTHEAVRQVEFSAGERTVPLRVSLTSLRTDDGEFVGLVVTLDDLSQVLHLQKVLAWREVARRIAHEIRNPLTPIQLSAERLERRFLPKGEDEAPFRECTRAILQEVSTIKQLVEEFTRFARMPAPTLRDGDLAPLVAEVAENFRRAYPEVELALEGPPSLALRFDPSQLRRALANLLENAAAALEGRGHAWIRYERLSHLGTVRISVMDDGPGVGEADRDHIFEPYFSRKEGGTGLGLAIVSAIASDHGGSVRFRPNLPHGAVFELDLPEGATGAG
jgi:two-component system nitrogen regulation sensor histidine kinase NtrY